MSETPSPAGGRASTREIAMTFDDLPAISVTRGDLASHRAITIRLVDGLRAHGIPAIGFVNERKLLTEGSIDGARVDLLRRWLDAGLELGNHTFSHSDLHAASPDAFEDDVVRGETVTRGLLRGKGTTLQYFRHPYLHTGTDLSIKRRLEELLAKRGCRVAPVTFYTEDYLFAAAYDRAMLRQDRRVAREVADAYVPYLERQVEYYEGLYRRLLGYEVRQVMVLHANVINAEKIGEIANMLEGRGYAFVPLARALEDPAYGAIDDYVGSEGISWLQRWALNLGHGPEFLDGEPVTPWLVRAQSGVGRAGRMVRWWTRLHGSRRRTAGAAAQG